MRLQGYRLLSVQTASMLPAIRPGDAVLVRRTKANQLQPGQVISYTSPRNHAVVISHRLVAIDQRTGWLTTQGDALHTLDPSFPPDLVVGQVTALAPGLGRLLSGLRRPLGLALAVYLPAALIIGTEAVRLGRTYARPFYSARLET
jgi:signal peptidase I